MCIITLVPLNVEVPVEAITIGAENNPDGHGWVVASPEHGLVVGKSMTPEEAIKDAVAERKRQGLGSVLLFHSRIGTHGSKTLANVHPFPVPEAGVEPAVEVSEDLTTVMAHNGILPSAWHPGAKDDRSDTRVFADEMAPWYLTERGVPSRRGAAALGEMIGRGNKLVFVSTALEGRVLYRIVNASSGTWDDGVWFSNTSYKERRTTTRVTSYGGGTRQVICKQKGCNTSFYPSGTESDLCFRHRPSTKMCAETQCYIHFVPYDNETKCSRHREGSKRKECAEKDCKTEVFLEDQTKCYIHRNGESAKDRGPGWVSPYSESKEGSTKPESWNGYGIYPGAGQEIDEETRSLLEDIDASLTAHDGTSGVKGDSFCGVCRARGTVHEATNWCLECKHCLDCWVEVRHCSCWDHQKWLKRRADEDEALAQALADAEEDALREAEAAEELWLAGLQQYDPEEQVLALMTYYGITREAALEIVTAPSEKDEEPVEEKPKRRRHNAPKSTAPKAGSARR